MSQKPILIVHPHDKTTSFLERIKNHLMMNFFDYVHYFNIKPNEISHANCLERIISHPATGVILFLGHGRSDRLYGSKGDSYGNVDFVSKEARDANPDEYYFNDNFINKENIEVFKGKKIICLACKSNDLIASNLAKFNNNISFLGFGDIPTSVIEFDIKGERNFPGTLVSTMKSEINIIIKNSLSYSLKKGHTFQELLFTIEFVTNQRIAFLLTSKWFKERYLVADYLYFFKEQASLFGDKNARLLTY